MADDDKRPIIKKIKKVQAAGAHGGAWKVAYADFTTAMMAFFMLLWLLNVAPPETLEGLAAYFTPTASTTRSRSGSEGPLGSDVDDVENVTIIATAASPVIIEGKPKTGDQKGQKLDRDEGDPENDSDKTKTSIAQVRENASFDAAQADIQAAIQKTPELIEMEDQIQFEQTEEGLEIQIVDKDRRTMFSGRTAQLYSYAEHLIETVGKTVRNLPNRIEISGHTRIEQFPAEETYTNWELSADRANAARRILHLTGVSDDKIAQVVGRASNDPLHIDQPRRLENSRITILLKREASVVPPEVLNAF